MINLILGCSVRESAYLPYIAIVNVTQGRVGEHRTTLDSYQQLAKLTSLGGASLHTLPETQAQVNYRTRTRLPQLSRPKHRLPLVESPRSLPAVQSPRFSHQLNDPSNLASQGFTEEVQLLASDATDQSGQGQVEGNEWETLFSAGDFEALNTAFTNAFDEWSETYSSQQDFGFDRFPRI